jgi:uncharacterized protein (TIGR02246 family)
MTKRRLCGLAFGLATSLVFCLLLQAPSTPAQQGGAKTKVKGKELTGSGKRAQAFIAAFNKGDAKAVAGFYTPTGAYIDQVGREYKGRAALEKLYTEVFAANKGAKLKIHVTSLRALTPDVAIEEGVNEVFPANGDPSSAAKFLAVLVKKDDVWYIESVQETIARPPSNAEHFADIAWLIGDWIGESNKGQSMRTSYSWAENQNFIVSAFAVTVNGIPVTGGHSWIAWDAVDKKIRSWAFFSGGGFGEGVWTQAGKNWIIRLNGKSAAGKKVSMTNVVTRVDFDQVTLQVTQLTVDGKEMPEGTVVKLKRVKPESPGATGAK